MMLLRNLFFVVILFLAGALGVEPVAMAEANGGGLLRKLKNAKTPNNAIQEPRNLESIEKARTAAPTTLFPTDNDPLPLSCNNCANCWGECCGQNCANCSGECCGQCCDGDCDGTGPFTRRRRIRCFPGSATVHAFGKGEFSMRNLKIGDKIQVAEDELFETVYAFAHHLSDEHEYEYIRITAYDDVHLDVSASHLIYVAGRKDPIRADAVQVGDALLLGTLHPNVTSVIKTVKENGAYAPLTLSGTLFVNGGLKVSSYTALQDKDPEYLRFGGNLPTGLSHQKLAQLYFSPFRVLCSNLPRTKLCHTYNDDGMPFYIADGIKFAEQVDRWPLLLQMACYVIFLVVYGTCYYLAECILMNHITAVALPAILMLLEFLLVCKIMNGRTRKEIAEDFGMYGNI